MKITVSRNFEITEIEASAQELRESQTLSQNVYGILSRCFQNREPVEDDDDIEEDEA